MVFFDPSTVRESRDGQRGVKAQVQPSPGSSRPRGSSRRWRDTSEWKTPGVYYADLTLGGRAITIKLLVREHKRDSGTHVRYLYTTDLQRRSRGGLSCGRSRSSTGTSRPWDSSFWRRERLQGHLAIFTVTNVVRELVKELNLRSVEAFLRFVERHLGGPPGLMKIFKLR